MQKKDGGLRLKNLRAWNLSLLAMTLWKIHLKKDSLWIKWVNHIYSNLGCVWQWRSNVDDSLLIKKLICIRDLLILREGSVEGATVCLEKWFEGRGGISRAYQFFVNNMGRWLWKPLICKSFILPKHKFALWLFAHDKFLTRDRLLFVIDKLCVFCKVENETLSHLFFDCHVSKDIWNEVRAWLGMNEMMGLSAAVLKAFRSVYRGNSMLNKMRITALAAMIYTIWIARNSAVFEDEVPNCAVLKLKIKILVLRCLPNSINAY